MAEKPRESDKLIDAEKPPPLPEAAPPPPPNGPSIFGKPIPAAVMAPLSCIFFLICSTGMSTVNKVVVVGFKGLAITVVIMQMVFTCLFLLIFLFRTLSFGSRGDVLRWSLSVPLLYAFVLGTSMLALKYASLGAATVVRNASPLLSLLLERFLIDDTLIIDCNTVLSLVFVLGGVTLYLMNDVQLTLIGFVLILVNMGCAVAAQVLQRKMIAVQPVNISRTGMLLLNNSIGLLPEIGFLLFFGEPTRWGELARQTTGMWGLLVLSCFIGVGIGWAGLLAQQYIAATSMIVLGNMNKLLVIAFGMVVFNEARSWQAVLGCAIALAGGVWYAAARMRISSMQKAAKAAAEEEGDTKERQGHDAASKV